MKLLNASLVMSLIVILLGCGQIQQTASPASGNGNGIIGGEEVIVGEAGSDHVVGLIFVSEPSPGEHSILLCTGVLVSNSVILTAAHCAATNYKIAYAVFSKSVLNPTASVVRKIVTKTLHSDWQPANAELERMDVYDLALLHFAGDLPSGYSKAEILTDASLLQRGVSVSILGYGVFSPNEDPTKEGTGFLRRGTVAIADSTSSPTTIIVDQSQGQGFCDGDSGGPSFINVKGKGPNDKGQDFLWGLAGQVYHNAPDSENPDAKTVPLCNRFGFETNLIPFAEWIQTNIESLETRS